MARTYRFEGTIRRIGSLYAVDVPDALSALAGRSYLPVVGTVNGFPFRGVLTPNAGGGHRLHLASEVRRQTGIVVGETVTIIAQPDPTSRVPPVPDDLAAALDAVDGARKRYEALSGGEKRQMVAWVESVGDAETRARRITRIVARIIDSDP